MSFLGMITPHLASLAAQPAVLAAGVATGVAVGAVGVGTGVIPVTGPGPRIVALFECPDSGRVVKNLPSNQNVLVTARSADGAWLEIYIGEAGAERGWARAASLQLKAAPESLPVADCNPTATAEPTFLATLGPPSSASLAPSAVPSAVPSGVPATVRPSAGSSATPAPTKTPKPTHAPTPTPVPLTGPVLSNLDVFAANDGGNGLYLVYYSCGAGYGNSLGMNVDAADPDGVAGVTIHWDPPGAPADSADMGDEDGSGTLWQGFIDSKPEWNPGPIHVWFQGVDKLGNLGPIFDSTDEGITFAFGACPP